MFRKALIKKQSVKNERFVWRSHEVFRIEAFSDAVFAFAITLLIVSLEVPESFDDLMNTMKGFFAFMFSFAILFQIWYGQYIFFRKYGLEDLYTISLNGVLIFVVLFYVYPLKFLFRLLFFTGNSATGKRVIELSQVPELMVIYGAGFLAIYFIFIMLYRHAFKKKDELKLTQQEIFFTKTKIYSNIIMVCIAVTAIVAALLVRQEDSGKTGFIYIGIGPILSIFYTLRGKKERKLFTSEIKSN